MANNNKAATINPWKQMVPVFLPKANDGDQNYARVVVNGKPYQIPRGKQQLVPKPVYEVLARSETARAITENYNDAMQEQAKNR